MTTTEDQATDPRAAAAALIGGLVGPGGPFAMEPADVLGATIPVFTNRRRSLGALLAESAEHGDRTYIATADRRISYAEHAAMVASLAERLRTEYGVKPGDRVAINAANSPEWILTFWATVSLGAICVAFNAWWSPSEVAYGLEHSDPTLLVVDARRAAALPEGVAVPVLTLEGDIPRLAAAAPGASLPDVEVAEDDPAVIIYTSGTSGRPKGAVHSHRNLLAAVEYHRMNDALATAFGDPTDPRDKTYLLVMPLFHIASLHNLAVPRLATGSKIALHEGGFDLDRVLALIERERVTHWGAVPTMARRLMEHPDLDKYDLSSLVAFALASAPSTPEFHAKLRARLPFAASLANSYGLTESCTAVAVATPMDLAEKPDTLGRPIIGVQVEIRDASGAPVPAGVEGEICVRGPYTMIGYWNDPDATASAIREDRWLHTGDIGMLDEQGRLSLSTRRSDLIIRGGENVYPAEIEGVLIEHPAVAEAMVLGVPDEDLGQSVAAVVVPRPGASVSEADLAAYVAERLAYFKVPTHWRFQAEPLPRNATGKVKRAEVSA
ncbi:acyl--CoA ligase [Nocardioides sp. GY 10113]|uniref:class I adenylate-forming enzyme family protein n=1 Tax=Nocardioides sp. GY 10113 TaxID=2569761 RepID=UPI0010A8F672|nr:class I adenylate-forming enzyme family protein [Nocardioides sp. GY 10113]TIC85112.1 acyl--CoA ligase [Nocardioides sp. GY 10113]